MKRRFFFRVPRVALILHLCASVASLLCLDLAGSGAGLAVFANGKSDTIRLRGLDGKTYDTSEMRGQVVLLSFGATWCAPCKAEIAALEELKREYAGRPVRFLWVSIESRHKASDGALRDYAKGLQMTIPVLRDPDMEVYEMFSPRVRIPLVVFVGKDGKAVLPAQIGMASPETYKSAVRARLDALLAGRSAPADLNTR
jgi:thiol-disulfide isomerase/thioredoxin